MAASTHDGFRSQGPSRFGGRAEVELTGGAVEIESLNPRCTAPTN